MSTAQVFEAIAARRTPRGESKPVKELTVDNGQIRSVDLSDPKPTPKPEVVDRVPRRVFD